MTIRPSACRRVGEAAVDNAMRRLARLETSSCVPEMAEENKILEEVTWLSGLVWAHDIFGEEIPKKLKHCHSQASAHQLQKQKAVRLGAG